MSSNDKNPLVNDDAFDEEGFLEVETGFDGDDLETEEPGRELTKVAKSNVHVTTDADGNIIYQLRFLDGGNTKGEWYDLSQAQVDTMCRNLYEEWQKESDDPGSVRFPDIYDVSEFLNEPERRMVREEKRHLRPSLFRQGVSDSDGETIELDIIFPAFSVRAQTVFHRRNSRGRVVSNDPQAMFDEDFLGLNQAERNLYLENLLKDKPQQWVEVLRLAHHHGYKGTEIAEALGMSPARVSQILKKITGRIRKENLEP